MPANIADAVPRLKRLIPRLRGKRIGVLGDLMLDRYLWGTASRLSPEAPVPVVDLVEQSECLGGAGNVAANISTLGGEVEAFGVIGNDEAGRALQKCLSAANIAAKGIIADSKRVTTVKTRIIARHQQVVRVDHERRESLRGEKGMSVFEESSPRHLHIRATGFEVTYARVGQPGIERGATGRQVFDVTGAGDTVLSVLALAVAAGAPLVDAAMLANTAAGVVVGKLGTASASPKELVHALDDIRQ